MYVFKLRTAFIVILLIAVLITSVTAFTSHYKSVAVSSEAEEDAVDTGLFGETVKVPIIMYHSILKDTKKSGKYVITPSQLEADLKYIRDNGYTTIVMQDLIDYVYNGAELPEKPIILTFDDGYYNNYLYAYPLLKTYNQKAVISIIGKYTDMYTENPDENANYAHVTWDNANEMQNSGFVEIQNHSYDMHTTDKGRNGTKKKKGETSEQYKKVLNDDIGRLQGMFLERMGYKPTTFTYPFGSISLESVDIIKDMGFVASLSCESGMNKLKRDPEELYRMKRYIRTPKESVEEILD